MFEGFGADVVKQLSLRFEGLCAQRGQAQVREGSCGKGVMLAGELGEEAFKARVVANPKQALALGGVLL